MKSNGKGYVSDADRNVSRIFGARIREARILAGVTQTALAEELGTTFQQLQKYERGENRVSVPTLLRMSKALGTTPAGLLEGLDAPGKFKPGRTATRQAMGLVRAFERITDPRVRLIAAEVVRVLAR